MFDEFSPYIWAAALFACIPYGCFLLLSLRRLRAMKTIERLSPTQGQTAPSATSASRPATALQEPALTIGAGKHLPDPPNPTDPSSDAGNRPHG